MSRRYLGAYDGVTTIDVRGLGCNVNILCSPFGITEMNVAGPWGLRRKVNVRASTSKEGGTTLVLTDPSGDGAAERSAQVHVVTSGNNYRRSTGSNVTVLAVVAVGVKVLY